MPIEIRRTDDDYRHVRDDLADISILLFDPVMERYAHSSAADSMGDRLRALDPSARNVELIILRGTGNAFEENAVSDAILPSVVGQTPTVLLVGGESPDAPTAFVRPPGFPTPPTLPSLELIRQIELEAICFRSGAMFQNPHFHYQLPTGLHADGFIRLGDALHDPVDVVRVADWVLPVLAPDGLLLADTGSILPLVQELARRIQIPFDCLRRYPPDRVSIERRIEDLHRQGGPSKPLNFLVSVTSSGRLLGQVQSVTNGEANLVTVVDAAMDDGVTPGHVLSRIPIQRWDVDERGQCSECPNRQLMPIAPHSYECSPGLNWQPVRLNHKHAETDRPFWEAVDATNAVTLHDSRPFFRDGRQARRHFGIYLDIAKLLTHEDFRECCKQRVAELRPPDVVLVPDHHCAPSVIDLIRNVFPSAKCCHLESAHLDANAEALVRGSSHVLIADDAIVTGATLRGLRIAVYRATQDMAPPPTIQAFVIVARPDRESDLKAVTRPYRSDEGSQLSYAKKLYLPEACPWCEEKDLLARVFDHLSDDSKKFANQRIQHFDAALTPPFLLGVRPDQIDEVVTKGSFFGELRHVTAYASCASAVQTLRTRFRTYQDGGIIDVVDLPMVIEAYFETVFPAAVLRTATRSQLWNPNNHNELGRDIERIDIGQVYPGTIAELALAAANSKIPQAGMVKLIDRALEVERDPYLVMLREVIQLNLG